MRGQEFSAMALQPQDTATVSNAATDTSLSVTAANPANNADRASLFSYTYKVGSLTWALLLLVLYVVWGYWDEKKTAAKTLGVGEIKANLSNFFKITIVVVIGINLINVFLTKLATLRIPVISNVAAAYIPLFSM